MLILRLLYWPSFVESFIHCCARRGSNPIGMKKHLLPVLLCTLAGAVTAQAALSFSFEMTVLVAEGDAFAVDDTVIVTLTTNSDLGTADTQTSDDIEWFYSLLGSSVWSEVTITDGDGNTLTTGSFEESGRAYEWLEAKDSTVTLQVGAKSTSYDDNTGLTIGDEVVSRIYSSLLTSDLSVDFDQDDDSATVDGTFTTGTYSITYDGGEDPYGYMLFTLYDDSSNEYTYSAQVSTLTISSAVTGALEDWAYLAYDPWHYLAEAKTWAYHFFYDDDEYYYLLAQGTYVLLRKRSDNAPDSLDGLELSLPMPDLTDLVIDGTSVTFYFTDTSVANGIIAVESNGIKEQLSAYTYDYVKLTKDIGLLSLSLTETVQGSSLSGDNYIELGYLLAFDGFDSGYSYGLYVRDDYAPDLDKLFLEQLKPDIMECIAEESSIASALGCFYDSFIAVEKSFDSFLEDHGSFIGGFICAESSE